MGLISRVSRRTYRIKKKKTNKMVNKNYASRQAWKANYFAKLENAIRNNSKFILVNADNVASLQFAQIRAALRGKATIVMGKNTMMKKCIRGLLNEFPDYEKVCRFWSPMLDSFSPTKISPPFETNFWITRLLPQ